MFALSSSPNHIPSSSDQFAIFWKNLWQHPKLTFWYLFRLELYMKQNHENVERAETELNILHEDMEQTLELQRRLAHR
jgi:hypothetical protein